MKQIARLLTILALSQPLLPPVQLAYGGLRVEARGVAPFTLREAMSQNTTVWYDAEDWLRQFPGSVERDAVYGRLLYREGDHWAALKAEPPFAIRDGKPIKGVPPVRGEAGRILVSERFLRDFAGEFLGRPVRALREVKGRRIVIDPGHGGTDAGSAGPADSSEKDLVLELARATGEVLQRLGFEVHYTRTGDHAINAVQRAAVANYWETDLYLSLHVAGAGRPQARGFEVFIAAEPAPGEDPSAWGAGQIGRYGRSLRWAERVRGALGEALPTFDRGLAPLPHPVLEAVAAPACLVELGNLAWPQDAEILQTAAGRVVVAEAIGRAAEGFFHDHYQNQN